MSKQRNLQIEEKFCKEFCFTNISCQKYVKVFHGISHATQQRLSCRLFVNYHLILTLFDLKKLNLTAQDLAVIN
jgi:hypothetical protein